MSSFRFITCNFVDILIYSEELSGDNNGGDNDNRNNHSKISMEKITIRSCYHMVHSAIWQMLR